eukprot:scaffold4024_cov222-Pinguiococcus_pyrenoidosus.AAC.1
MEFHRSKFRREHKGRTCVHFEAVPLAPWRRQTTPIGWSQLCVRNGRSVHIGHSVATHNNSALAPQVRLQVEYYVKWGELVVLGRACAER